MGWLVVRRTPPARRAGGAWRVSVGSLFRVQQLVDAVLKRVEGEGPGEEFDRFDRRRVSLGIAQEECRCARHTGALALLETGINLRGVFATVQTGLEGRHVEPKGLGMVPQRLGLQLLLIGEQAVVHVPAFALLVGTPIRLGGFASKLVDRLQGKVAGDIAQLPRRNVFFLQLGQRLTDVSGTEGSLVVGEFDECERGLLVALREGIGDIDRGVDVTNRRALVPTR